MSQVNQYVEVPQEAKYRLVPPDGGWGYLVVLAFIVQSVITNIPTTAFGLLYGDFLDSIGDETTGTALSTGLFFTAQSFSGFVTDILLRKYNCRKVGVMGATLYFLGAFGQIFVHTLPHMILCFSAMQGLANGLLIAAVVSSFNSYFTKKMNLMMGIAQSVSILSVMLTPYFIETVMKTIGFRKTLCILAGLALVILVAVSFLDPVEKHMRKIYMDGEASIESLDGDENKITDEGTLGISTIPIIQEESDTKTLGTLEAKMRASLSNLGQRTISSMTLNKDQRKRGKVLDFRLFMDWKFMAVNLGLSTAFAADVCFVALIPVLLGEINFSTQEIAFMMTMFFASDLGARILYSIVNTFYRPKSRHVYLFGVVFSALVRTIFTANNSWIWRLVTLGILGFLRCFIQTTLMLVLSEEYKDNFVTSFSISMILCGIVNLFFGLLGSFLKYTTGQSVIVLHLLTLGFVICIVLWTAEMLYTRFKSKRETINRL